ncbi:MAG TPA: tail fiber domain-containing protein, partial [Bacteroidia bacterium]|nr:tail fiber domain-containing protein [Bacteroidia bacterium]
MKTVKLISLTLAFLTITFKSNAQLRVVGNNNSGLTVGNIGIGTTAPVSKLEVIGNGLFTKSGGISSAAYIYGNNIYSLATTPDYSWYHDDSTGLFHPSASTIGFSLQGAEVMKIFKNGGTNPQVKISGDLNLNALGNTIQINSIPVLYQNSVATCMFVGPWAGASNTAYGNTAVGNYALFANTTAKPNDAFGNQALLHNTSGSYNAAFGDSTLYTNTTGVGNLGVGAWALTSNSSGGTNIGVGAKSLTLNTTGSENIGIGYGALYSNTSGSNNVGVGYQVLKNTTSSTGGNTAIGYEAQYTNTTGQYNVAVGYYAGYNYTGSYNTFVGVAADAGATSYTNCAAFGYSATVLGSNKVIIGNGSVTQIAGYQAWTNLSDGRFKTHVTENVKGLAFIKKLRPVTYNLDTKALDDFITQNMSDSAKTMHKAGLDFTASKAMVHSGFIAQEVEQAAQQVGFTNSIVNAPANSNDVYALSYAEFVVPLVKAVQELAGKTDSLSTINHKQDSTINALRTQIINCCAASSNNNGATGANNTNNTTGTNSTAGINSQPTGNGTQSTSAILYQNTPNPFSQTTVVKCFVPEGSKAASLL